MGNNSGGTCAVLVHRESARAPADDGCEGQAGESADPRLIAMSDRDPVFMKSKRSLDLLEIYVIVSTR